MTSVLKTLSYSATHFVVAFAVAFSLTRSWQAAAAIGLVEPLVQTFAYAVHEHLWKSSIGNPSLRGQPVAARGGARDAWAKP